MTLKPNARCVIRPGRDDPDMTDELDHALDVAVRRTRDAQGRVAGEVIRGAPPEPGDVHQVVRGAQDIDELAAAAAVADDVVGPTRPAEED
jgi:hypothetical protein